jgi:DNA-binding protein YbaB
MSESADFESIQRGIADQWLSRGRAVQAEVNGIKVRTSSRNGELGVTVDAQGHVQDVRLTPQALRLGERRLAQVLLETIQRAEAEAEKQLKQAWKPLTSDPAVREIMEFGRELIKPKGRRPQ